MRFCRLTALSTYLSGLPRLAIIIVCALVCGKCTGQVYRSVAPPPSMLGPPAAGVQTLAAGFDPFGPTSSGKIKLRSWQTFDIPPGSWGDPNQWGDKTGLTTIERYRKSFVQKVELSGGYVHRNHSSDPGYSWAAAGITMVVPLGSTDNLIVVTPRYRTDWIDGPMAIDVPARLHSGWLDIGWRYKFNSQWSTIVGVRPGVFSDYKTSVDGFRLGGLGLVTYQMIPERLTFSVGVVYLGRNDLSIIPAVGMTWIPNPDTRFDLNFPKPKISRRVSHIPYLLEDWVYVAASFGGGTWSVRRMSGADDELTLKDYRVSVGFERIINGGTGFNIDIGYVFGRQLEYEMSATNVDFGDSFVVETGLSF